MCFFERTQPIGCRLVPCQKATTPQKTLQYLGARPVSRLLGMSSTTPSTSSAPSKLLRVLVCGGGNAAHVLVGQLSARGHCVTMLSTFPKEAQGIRKGCDANGGVEVRGWGVKGAETIKGRPAAIVSTFADAFASLRSRQGVRFDLVILAVPAPHHEHYLQGLALYLRKSAATDARETPNTGTPAPTAPMSYPPSSMPPWRKEGSTWPPDKRFPTPGWRKVSTSAKSSSRVWKLCRGRAAWLVKARCVRFSGPRIP